MLRTASLAAIIALGAIGCDNKTEQPKPPEPAPATLPAAPTTHPAESAHDDLTGPMRKTALGGLPLVITIPGSWKVSAAGHIPLISGFAGDELVTMRASQLLNPNKPDDGPWLLRKGEVDATCEAAKKRSGGQVEVTMQGQARCVDERRPAADGTLQWTKTFYVPQNATDWVAYQVSFMSLAKSTYDTYRAPLERMAASLTYVPQTP